LHLVRIVIVTVIFTLPGAERGDRAPLFSVLQKMPAIFEQYLPKRS